MTPRDLLLFVEDYNEKKKVENEKRQNDKEDALIVAYLNAVWERSRRIPPLKSVLSNMQPKKKLQPQTPAEMLAVVKRLQASFEGREE